MASSDLLIAFWRWTTHDPVAFYTSMLALFTAVLGISANGQWIATSRGFTHQTRDTQIIQRAYVSVEPDGLTAHRDREDRLHTSVIFRNVGHLPARNVRWYGTFGNPDGKNFPVKEPTSGKIV